MSEGQFTIPARLYLSEAQRAKLQHLLAGLDRELDDWLTELVAARLDALPDPPPAATAGPGGQGAEEVPRPRAALRRLRPRLGDPHNPPPPWLVQLVADLEAEVRRLERAAGGGADG